MQYKHTRLLYIFEILYSAFFLLDALLPKNTEIFYRGCGMSGDALALAETRDLLAGITVKP